MAKARLFNISGWAPSLATIKNQSEKSWMNLDDVGA